MAKCWKDSAALDPALAARPSADRRPTLALTKRLRIFLQKILVFSADRLILVSRNLGLNFTKEKLKMTSYSRKFFTFWNFLFFWGALFSLHYSTVSAQEVLTADEQLRYAFEGAGYFDAELKIDDCHLTRTVADYSFGAGDGIQSILMYYNIASINSEIGAKYRSRSYNGGTLFIAEFSLRESYLRTYDRIVDFGKWVGRTYPESNWPYELPSDRDTFSLEIEKELYERIPEINEMNRRVYLFSDGPLTLALEKTITLSSFDQSGLEALVGQILSYSRSIPCE